MDSKASEASISSCDYAVAAEVIKNGGIVAFPTETYYGLAADPFNPKTLARLFQIKKRNQDKPILTLIQQTSQLALLTDEIPVLFRPLMRDFWPGPVTMIFPCHPHLSELLTGGTKTIGIRISSHPMAMLLGQEVERPITATSANISGCPAAVTAQEVRLQLGGSVDLIIDGGPTPGGCGSTIVSQMDGRLTLVRPGVIPFAKLLSRSGG